MVESIGNKIRIQRLTKNYSQEYMAFMLSISQPAYSKIERDETTLTIPRVFEIAEILEISPYILMPKPKHGIGINHEAIWKTINKIKSFWKKGIDQRRKEADKLNFIHSDKSNSSN